MSSFDIVLAGVGGQGILLVSRVLMEEAIGRGSAARGGETRGMARRGGSVVSHVRLGPCHSAQVVPGRASLLLGFERMEALRCLRYLRRGGLLMADAANDGFLVDEVRAYLERAAVRVLLLDASRVAGEAGLPRAVNVLLTGFAAAHPETPFSLEGLRDTLPRVVRPEILEGCLAAVELGHRAGAAALATP